MATLKGRRIAVKLDDVVVSAFLNKDLVKGFREELKEAQFTHFCLVVRKKDKTKEGKEDIELIHIAHDSLEDIDGKKLSVKADTPEVFEKAYSVVRRFLEG